MQDRKDMFEQERTSVLRIFKTVAINNFGDDGLADIRMAFNRAASYIEDQPGIVEYYHYGKEHVNATDGTSFRTWLHDITTDTRDAELRRRAYECLGNISKRCSDFVYCHYDLEKLRYRIFEDGDEMAQAEALKAYAKIVNTRHRNPNAFTTLEAQSSWVNAGKEGGYTMTHFSYPPHPLVTYGLERIPYGDALAGLCAQALLVKSKPALRLAAAEISLTLADDQAAAGIPSHPYSDYKSLARFLVKPFVAVEQDPAVRAVFDALLDTREEKRAATQDAVLSSFTLNPRPFPAR